MTRSPRPAPPQRVDGDDDADEALPLAVRHRATSSSSTRFATSGLRSLAGTRSTGAPMMRSRSSRTRPRPTSPRPAAGSPSRSTSESGSSSPRATLGNTRRLAAAASTTFRRFRRTLFPSDRKADHTPTRHTSSHPHLQSFRSHDLPTSTTPTAAAWQAQHRGHLYDLYAGRSRSRRSRIQARTRVDAGRCCASATRSTASCSSALSRTE